MTDFDSESFENSIVEDKPGEEPGFLQNHFLIAMPHLADPWFSHTVTYIWKHSNDGAVGIVINRPMKATIADVFNELEITSKLNEVNPAIHERKVLLGGPVEKDKGFILHDSGEKWDSTLEITKELSISTSKDILRDIAHCKGPQNYLIALGCAGWEQGQLEEEISNNFWLTVPADVKLIFSTDYENKAKAAAAILGVNLDHVSTQAGHS